MAHDKARYAKNGHLTVRIDSMAYGGRGVGRGGDGKVVFVSGVIPGETVTARVTREHKGFIEAELHELLVASPLRVMPPCLYFSVCGGCDWQHIRYSAQVAFKQEILKEQVRIKNPCEGPKIEVPFVSPDEYSYRCHAIIRCTHNNGFKMGFFRKKSNTVIDFDRCIILEQRCQEMFGRMKELLKTYPIRRLDSIEIHAPGEEFIARACVRGFPFKEDLLILKRIYQELGLAGLEYFPIKAANQGRIFGQQVCLYELALHGKKVALASCFGGFIQANMKVNEGLVAHVIDCMRDSQKVLDLYSGAGNFSIPLSLEIDQVTAVEQNPALVRIGVFLAHKNGLKNLLFIKGDAARAVRNYVQQGAGFDTVVIDPPREGARETVQGLAHMKTDRVVYISCNPSTLARDLAILTSTGFRIKGLRLFDMFPQTYHIESVTVLERD